MGDGGSGSQGCTDCTWRPGLQWKELTAVWPPSCIAKGYPWRLGVSWIALHPWGRWFLLLIQPDGPWWCFHPPSLLCKSLGKTVSSSTEEQNIEVFVCLLMEQPIGNPLGTLRWRICWKEQRVQWIRV
jgi:hypothetical protein